MSYVVARNRSGKPTLQHALAPYRADRTACGRDVGGWSRAYMETAIPEILCYSCAKKAEKAAPALERHLRAVSA